MLQLDIVLISVHTPAQEQAMDVMTFSDTRANLKKVMDHVVADRTPVIVTRQKAEAVVMISLADWSAIEETLHLLSSPRNVERLGAAIRQLDEGKGSERDLMEP
jgi:antitoxin YefM